MPTAQRFLRRLAPLALASLLIPSAHAFTVTSFSPQGTVAKVQQVVVKFNEDVVRFGDPKAPAPFTVRCDGAGAQGAQSRWTGPREWVTDFDGNLPPGVGCEAQAVPDFKSTSGGTLSGKTTYRFNTGGPQVQAVDPGEYQAIEEQQVFLLELSGPATPASIAANVWCDLDDLGERVPVTLVTGQERDAILDATDNTKAAKASPDAFQAVRCTRRLTAGGSMELVYGAGVAAPNGAATDEDQRFHFNVREPFTFYTSCVRENARAACVPIQPLDVYFSAPVPNKWLKKIHLSAGDTQYEPHFGEGEDEGDSSHVQFAGPFPPKSTLKLTLPDGLVDASGRALVNEDKSKLDIAVAGMPPIAKFSSGDFGVIERFAEGPDQGPALLPLTLRGTEAHVKDPQASGPQLYDYTAKSDADIIHWFDLAQRYADGNWVRRAAAEREASTPLPPPTKSNPDDIDARALGLLAGRANVAKLALPPAPHAKPRPFEVIGVPLQPGFHVLEVQSKALGALLDPDYGADREMYVRTSALVTNLGVHFKLGRSDSLAWVTTLNTGAPVSGAQVQISDCTGARVADGVTDDHGIARFKDLPVDARSCDRTTLPSAYFVSARAQNQGAADMAFTWTSWQDGIEPWRFNVPTSQSAAPDTIAHTIFDRTLLRAGETVSMKQVLRTETDTGFGLPRDLPSKLVITHLGSGQEFTQALRWRDNGAGAISAENAFQTPKDAKLGAYDVTLTGSYIRGGQRHQISYDSGSFQVEEFRLPVFQGSVAPTEKGPLVAPKTIPVQVQINYINGGAAAELPVQVSATTRTTRPDFADWDSYSFNPPRSAKSDDSASNDETDDQRVIADKLRMVLDTQGLGTVTITDLKPKAQPQHLTLEATYPDPNGEIQTLATSRTIWPAAVVAGIKAQNWVSAGKDTPVQVLALDTSGKPQAKVSLDVRAVQRVTKTTRKRMVGGFYAYDSHTETTDLGTVCTGKSDDRGLLNCKVSLKAPGEIELIAQARDGDDRVSRAATSIWVTQEGELWFGGNNDDRIDVLPEKKSYQPGETARFQVRMPFREATALVTVEREGILHREVVHLKGDDPTVTLQVDPKWGPNVYVSAFVVRGRIYEVPWYSFFTWGFKSPRAWWDSYQMSQKAYVPPTALIDLSKPAFRFGMAPIQVGDAAYKLAVEVKPEHATYQIRDKARVKIHVNQPDGTPAAHADVALAAVDQALLELKPNDSWKLLDAMMATRPWGVQTSTAQMEVVGRRHYGRKAVPAGGGGGKSQTRELFDTLLLWKPDLQLDAHGDATVEVPLNDSLTTFQIVAVADLGTSLFGTGQAAIKTRQNLQIISGLPPLVREGDHFQAMLTLRNSTEAAMKVAVAPEANLLPALAAQTVEIPPESAQTVTWDVVAPNQLPGKRTDELAWSISAKDGVSGAHDAIKVSSRIVPAVPITVRQATLTQIDGFYTQDVEPPAAGLAADGVKLGGLNIAFQPKLATGLPGVRDWFARYPYTCLEQLTSKFIGMDDVTQWKSLLGRMPTYLDDDGLAYYFPPRDATRQRGSDILTAYVLAATDEASKLNPEWALPDDVASKMTEGLTKFVTGRITRDFWSPRKDLDVRKLAAIEALARYHAAEPAMLESITIAPNSWPTGAVIDWISVLKRMDNIPQRDQKLEHALQILRSRISVQGTRMVFSTEQDDDWWWLMQGGDVNAARLLLAVMDDPAWKDDLPRLITGFIARQKDGAWRTTIANLWGSLALREFSKHFEQEPVAGVTKVAYDGATQDVTWAQVKPLKDNSAAAPFGRFFGAPSTPESLTNNRAFFPWASDPAQHTLVITQAGTGKPWLTLQSLAAVKLDAPVASGYRIKKTVTPVEQTDKSLSAGHYKRGDILRVKLEVKGDADMTWVAITDPVPTGATILGGGLGRDSSIATAGEKSTSSSWSWPAFEERSFESFRSYYEYLPKGSVTMEYTVRLNNAGTFQLPPSRVEALYAPEMFGEAPNDDVVVEP